MEKWIGKVAVVTGADSRVGEAILKGLARAGINVIGLARHTEMVDDVSEALGEVLGIVYSRKCDVSNLESVKEAFNWIGEQFGSISILINCAGIGEKAKETNLVHCTQDAVRLIKKSKDFGIIINTVGVYDNDNNPEKFSIKTVTEVLRQELLSQGNEKIRLTNLSPAVPDSFKYTNEFYRHMPYLKAENVSKVVVFLLELPVDVNIAQLTFEPLKSVA